VSCQTVELKPKVKFNGLLKSILTECISRNHKRIAVLYGNEILLSSKFYGILEKALVEINPEFHLLFMVHKFTLPQIKEWSKCDADPKDYTFLYEDMKNKSEVAIQNHWKSYGNKEYRVPKISVELSKNLVDNKWGFIINQPAMRPMLQMLESMNPKQLLLENILIEYQRKYGHSFYTLPNLIIPRQPNVQRLKKVCASNGWFHNFFEIK